MPTEFEYDVFLSHSAKDKAVVRAIAERLRVWFDDWEIRPGDNIPAKIKEGLEHSRGPALCMSAYAFGSGWSQLACPAVAPERRRKAGTFRFRDPLNKERRFIPLRLDDCTTEKKRALCTHPLVRVCRTLLEIGNTFRGMATCRASCSSSFIAG